MFGTAHTPYYLTVKDKDKAKDKDKDIDPYNHIKTGVDRRPTSTSRTEHLSKFKLDLLTNYLGTMGAGHM